MDQDDRYDLIETCNSLWVFDTRGRRFLRLPRGSARPSSLSLIPESAFEHYESLTLDPVSGEFLVKLTQDGSRMLRSRRHPNPCPACDTLGAARLTTELSTVEIALAAEEER